MPAKRRPATGKRRAAIGDNPLDVYVSGGKIGKEPDRTSRQILDGLSKASVPAKVRASVHLTAETLDRARDAAVYLRTTLAALADEALAREIARLERVHNGGKRFPRRGAPLHTGRAIKE